MKTFFGEKEVMLASWKIRYLSLGGRVTLLKSVLQQSTYLLSLYFQDSQTVAKEIDKPQSRFLEGGCDFKRKLHLVNWQKVTRSKNCEGLNVRKIRVMNDCLLFKLWWRCGIEKESLWRRLISAKYGRGESQWLPN